ncbi:hypothetical protein [Kitasatospora phosalacinea]|uniref:hypothetical protein n=1 Tax=Kitasatospora phosalacinea TaxID=2065 RepID=UPI000A66D6D3|nr:hypothetical protein [Kitasatospora phosalacinea]
MAAGARQARVDPLLADRVVEALLLVGLPVAHGGHGPGVHLCATETDGSDGTPDRDLWPVTLRWLCSARLEDAAAAADSGGGAGSPWPRTRQSVVNSVETALAEFLPALGLTATRTAPDGPTLVGPGEPVVPAAALTADGPLGASAGEPPAVEPPAAEVVAAVRRGAALAGLPLARHPRAAGVALTACPPVADAAGAAPVVDAAWRSSPRLPGSPAVSTAVGEAMHHAVGTALTACGLRTSWHRPPDGAPHLHVADR